MKSAKTINDLQPKSLDEIDITSVRDSEDLVAIEEEKLARAQLINKLRLLWQQRKFLLRTTAYGFLIATLAAFVIPTRYRSVVRLMPPDNRSGSSLAMAAVSLFGRAAGDAANSSMGGELGSDLLGVRGTSDLFAAILKSRTVEDQLIKKFNLKRIYWDRRIEDARKHLEDHTDVSVDRKSQIITIRVTDHDRYRAAAMAQAYVEGLNQAVTQLSTSSARREREFLEERLTGVKHELEQAEKDLSQYASNNTTLDIKEQNKAMLEAAATLQGQLIAAQSKVEGLKQIYTPNNVRVRAAQAQVTELRNELNKIGGKGETSGAGSAQQNEFYPSIRRLSLLGANYADLYRNVKVREATFEMLTREYEMAKVQEAKEIPNVKVLDPPDVPEKRSFPSRTLTVSVGTFFGVVIGIGWVLLAAKWHETDPADPAKVLAQEVIADIRSGHLWVHGNGSRPSV